VTGSAFRFRLERVRAVRERKEKLAEQELAKAIRLRTSTEVELRSVEEHLQAAHLEQRSRAAELTTFDATELVARQAFVERIEAQRHAQAGELRLRESEVADRGVELTAAAGEHEMLKRLKERHRTEHDREAARREGNMLDEIAAVRFGRSPA
jgi:flagellar export protein FliJ